MANELLEVEVFSAADPRVRLNVLDTRTNPSFMQEIRGNGGGDVAIPVVDDKVQADPALLAYRNVLKLKANGQVVGACLIGKKATDFINDDPAKEVIRVTGEGLKTWFNDAVVHPAGGLKKSSKEQRFFNFSTERGAWYNSGDWSAPYEMMKVGDVPGPWRYGPQEWPDAPDAKWVWSQNGASSAPAGDVYFRYEFTADEKATYSFFTAGDDLYTVYIDGEQVVTTDPDAANWSEMVRTDLELDEGDHVFAAKVTNKAVGTAGFVAAIFTYGDPNEPSSATLVTYTGKAGDTDWLCCGYPENPPGWSPGEILLTLMSEAEDRGVLFPTWLTPTFTAAEDSNEVAWDRSLDWTFDVGSPLSTVISQLEELVCDIWIDPDIDPVSNSYLLHAVAERGVDRSDYGYDETVEYLVATNGAKNSSPQTVLTGWQPSGYGTGGAGSTSRVAGEGVDGGYGAVTTWTSTPTGGGATAAYGRNDANDDVSVAHLADTTAPFSIFAKPNRAADVSPAVLFFDSSNAQIGVEVVGTAEPMVAGVYERITVDAPVPSNADHARIGARIVSLTGQKWMGTRTNKYFNPVFANAPSGVVARVNSTEANVTQESGADFGATYCVRATKTTTNAARFSFVGGTEFAASTLYTIRFKFRSNVNMTVGGSGSSALFQYRPDYTQTANALNLNANFLVDGVAVTNIVAGVIYDVAMTFTTNATTTTSNTAIVLRTEQAATGGATAGNYMEVANFSIEAGDTLGHPIGFFYGGSSFPGRTAAWTSTANNSTSTLTGDALAIDRASTAPGEWFNGQTQDTPGVHYAWDSGAYTSVSKKFLYGVDRPKLVFEKGKNLGRSSTDGIGEMANTVLLQTTDGWVVASDQETDSETRFGVLEASINTGASETLSGYIAEEVFRQKALAEEGASYIIVPIPGYVPWVDFDIGDWVLAPDERGVLVKRRVMSISVEEDEAGNPSYSVEFDNIFQDTENRLDRFLKKLSGSVGSQFSNGSVSYNPIGRPVVPPPSRPVRKIPAQVQNVQVESVGYWTEAAEALSEAHVTWNAVTLNTDGTSTVPEIYEVWGYIDGEADSLMMFAATTTDEAYIRGLVPGVTWVFMVRARNPNTFYGAYSDPEPHTMLAPVPLTDVPSTPEVLSWMGVLVVAWDGSLLGEDENGQFAYNAPSFVTHVNVWVSVGEDFGSEEGEGDGIIDSWNDYVRVGFLTTGSRTQSFGGVHVGDVVRVRLTAVTRLGQETDPSEYVELTVTGITGADLVAGSVTANEIAAGSITTNHLAPGFGDDLDISANGSINLIAGPGGALDQINGDVTDLAGDLAETRSVFQVTSEGARIFKEGSVFDITLSNDEMQFREGGVKRAYLNAGVFYAPQLSSGQLVFQHHIIQDNEDGTVIRRLV